MNRKALIRIVVLTFMFSFLGFSTAHAVMFKMLGAKDLGKASGTSGSMAIKGTVLKILKDEQKSLLIVTFKVEEWLRGGREGSKNGDEITLNFAIPTLKNNFRSYLMQIPPPLLNEGMQTVLFVTKNFAGNYSLIGGEQGQMFVTKSAGKEYIYNNLGNVNLIPNSNQSSNKLIQKIVGDMQQRGEGTISYDDFKKLINQ